MTLSSLQLLLKKSMAAMEEKKYTFSVHPDATKTQIKEAVEKMFAGAKVEISSHNESITARTARRGTCSYGKDG